MKVVHLAFIHLTLRAKAPEVPVGVVMEGAVNGVQPMVGAMNELIKALSEPFERTRYTVNNYTLLPSQVTS